MSRRVRIFRSDVGLEAHLAWAALDAAGIRAWVHGADLVPGSHGMEPHATVWVDETDVSEARAVLGSREDERGGLALADGGGGRLALAPEEGTVALAEPATCPACGADWEPGFAECWSCSAPVG